MSSFLGACDPSGGLVVLARNVQVSVSTTAAQAIYTAGGQRAVPMYAVLRAGATALSATTSFKVGVTGALAAVVPTIVATSLATSASSCMGVPCVGLAAGSTAAVTVAPAAVVYFSAVQVDPTATTSFIDLIGYLA